MAIPPLTRSPLYDHLLGPVEVEEVPCRVFRNISNAISATFTKIKNVFMRCMRWITNGIRNLYGCPKRPARIVPGAGPRLAPPTVPPIPILEIPPAILTSVAINEDAVVLAPRPFDPTTLRHIAREANPRIAQEEILDLFDGIFADIPDGEVIDNDQGIPITKANARERIKTGYLNYIQTHGNQGGVGYNPLVAKSMDLYLKGVIYELRKDEHSLEKKQEALKNLAQAASHCPPRRHEEAKKVYLVLSSQMETLDQIILGYVQQAKEALFRNYYSLSNEPVMTLNYIRRIVGVELGLDVDPINLEDIHIGMNNAISPENRNNKHTTRKEFVATFTRIYTPENLIKLTLHSINLRIASDAGFARDLSRFIHNEISHHVQTGNLGDPELAALPLPYQFPYDKPGKGYHLTTYGIRFLLVHFKLLNSRTPNGHLVRIADIPPGDPAQPEVEEQIDPAVVRAQQEANEAALSARVAAIRAATALRAPAPVADADPRLLIPAVA